MNLRYSNATGQTNDRYGTDFGHPMTSVRFRHGLKKVPVCFSILIFFRIYKYYLLVIHYTITYVHVVIHHYRG